MALNDWIYIYYIRDGKLFHDRTVSRSGLGPARAKQIVEHWKAMGFESFYTIGCLAREPAFS